MDLELRHLRMVCTIAETGSLTKAAASLGLAQAALATQLGRIERGLGGPLFERDRNGARPTPLGELILARARVLLPAVDDLHAEATRLTDAGQAALSFRIGATNGPIMGGLVHRLTTAYPEATVTTQTNWSEEDLADMVFARKLDYALVGACGDATPTPYGVTWRPVSVDAVWILMAEQHPLAGRAEVALGDLSGARWANAPGDGCFIDCFAEACAKAGFTPRQILESDPIGCLDLVLSGAAVLLCQGISRPPPGTVLVPLAGTPLRWRHLLGWHPESPAAIRAPEVLTLAAAAYQEVVTHRPHYAAWLATHADFGAVTGG
ncbi:LysR family transcriptional regulator [Phytohabitans rumicis]|uniref:LysR substrate-binding domain-containing protein n=1 Tax=Phytohabitans rumicis TaxID=1076125 RepID=UPI0031EA9E1E